MKKRLEEERMLGGVRGQDEEGCPPLLFSDQ